MHQTFLTAILLLVVAYLASAVGAFAPSGALSVTTPSTSTSLHMAQMGPVARAKKMANPKEYNRIVEQKMEMEGLTRQQAEAEYNQFLENPPFYYALDKKADYYKSKGYKTMYEGMIGEAEKEGRGEEVRERLEKFQRTNKIKAASVLAVAIGSFLFARSAYWADPDTFLPGI